MGATGALILALGEAPPDAATCCARRWTRPRSSPPSWSSSWSARASSPSPSTAWTATVWVEHLLTSLPGGQVGFLIVVNLLVFFLAFFLDFFELAFIVIPLIGPVAEKLGIDLIWFGVMLGVNMQTSFMHPPFGFALFYLRSVAPKRALHGQRHRQAHGRRSRPARSTGVPCRSWCIQVIMVALVIALPGDGHGLQGHRRQRLTRTRSSSSTSRRSTSRRSTSARRPGSTAGRRRDWRRRRNRKDQAGTGEAPGSSARSRLLALPLTGQNPGSRLSGIMSGGGDRG